MDEALTIGVSRHGAEARTELAGEVDLSTAAQLRAEALAAAEGCDALTLDLSHVEFIDSSGLSTLLELRSTLARHGVRLQILAPDGPVRQAVLSTGLGELLAD